MRQIPNEKMKDIIELVRLTSIEVWCANVMGSSAKNRMPSDAFIEKLIGPFDLLFGCIRYEAPSCLE